MGWRGLEERPGIAGTLRRLGDWEGHLGAPMGWRGLEERPGFAGTLRRLGGLGGHLGAPHLKQEHAFASRLRIEQAVRFVRLVQPEAVRE